MKIDIPVRDRIDHTVVTMLSLDLDTKYNALTRESFIIYFVEQAEQLLDDLTEYIVSVAREHGVVDECVILGEEVHILDKTMEWIHEQILFYKTYK